MVTGLRNCEILIYALASCVEDGEMWKDFSWISFFYKGII